MRHLLATRGEQDFDWRGGEITRLEAFSDAVFAFAVTLLVVSLEVPHTYHDLLNVMKGFPAFAICFALLSQVWYQHALFFRRYGLQDTYITFLNCVLLFVVLFYVYPLKFLFTLLMGNLSGGRLLPAGAREPAAVGDARWLMIIYGLGFAAVFFTLALMYWQAYKKRASLELDDLETHRTKHSLVDHLAMTLIGLLSAVLAVVLPEQMVGLAGFIYFGIGAYHSIAGAKFGKKDRVIRERMQRNAATATNR